MLLTLHILGSCYVVEHNKKNVAKEQIDHAALEDLYTMINMLPDSLVW